jgi:hypothetical protein
MSAERFHSVVLTNREDNFSDIEVVAKGRTFYLHRYVLASAEYFRAIFLGKWNDIVNNTISMASIESAVPETTENSFVLLFEYLYTGAVATVHIHEALPLLKLAQFFTLDHLIQHVINRYASGMFKLFLAFEVNMEIPQNEKLGILCGDGNQVFHDYDTSVQLSDEFVIHLFHDPLVPWAGKLLLLRQYTHLYDHLSKNVPLIAIPEVNHRPISATELGKLLRNDRNYKSMDAQAFRFCAQLSTNRYAYWVDKETMPESIQIFKSYPEDDKHCVEVIIEDWYFHFHCNIRVELYVQFKGEIHSNWIRYEFDIGKEDTDAVNVKLFRIDSRKVTSIHGICVIRTIEEFEIEHVPFTIKDERMDHTNPITKNSDLKPEPDYPGIYQFYSEKSGKNDWYNLTDDEQEPWNVKYAQELQDYWHKLEEYHNTNLKPTKKQKV